MTTRGSSEVERRRLRVRPHAGVLRPVRPPEQVPPSGFITSPDACPWLYLNLR